MRLDIYLVQKGFVESRNKAQELIKSGKVLINGKITKKTSKDIWDEKIEIIQEKDYVGRAGWKLRYFLNELKEMNYNFENLKGLDIGSSTGGFSEVLLEENLKKITAVDVGKNQFHPKLKSNPKIELFEETDIRNFEPKEKFDLIVVDVSFISIFQIIEKIDQLAKKYIIILFKPQFELSKNVLRNKKGVIKDKSEIEKIKEKSLIKIKKDFKWKLIHQNKSQLKGKEGNQEFLFFFEK